MQDLNIPSLSTIALEVNSASPVLGKEEMATFKLKHIIARTKAPYSTLYHEKVRGGVGECVSVCLSFLTKVSIIILISAEAEKSTVVGGIPPEGKKHMKVFLFTLAWMSRHKM